MKAVLFVLIVVVVIAKVSTKISSEQISRNGTQNNLSNGKTETNYHDKNLTYLGRSHSVMSAPQLFGVTKSASKHDARDASSYKDISGQTTLYKEQNRISNQQNNSILRAYYQFPPDAETKSEKIKREAKALTSSLNMANANNIIVQGDFDGKKLVSLNFPLTSFLAENIEPSSEKPIVLTAHFFSGSSSNEVDDMKEKKLSLESKDKVLYLKSLSEEVQPLLKEHARKNGYAEVEFSNIGDGANLKCPGICQSKDKSGKCFLDLRCLKEFYKKK